MKFYSITLLLLAVLFFASCGDKVKNVYVQDGAHVTEYLNGEGLVDSIYVTKGDVVLVTVFEVKPTANFLKMGNTKWPNCPSSFENCVKNCRLNPRGNEATCVALCLFLPDCKEFSSSTSYLKTTYVDSNNVKKPLILYFSESKHLWEREIVHERDGFIIREHLDAKGSVDSLYMTSGKLTYVLVYDGDKQPQAGFSKQADNDQIPEHCLRSWRNCLDNCWNESKGEGGATFINCVEGNKCTIADCDSPSPKIYVTTVLEGAIVPTTIKIR